MGRYMQVDRVRESENETSITHVKGTVLLGH